MANYTRYLPFEEVNRVVLANRSYEQWVPGGRFQGHEYVALNPTRQDKNLGSFKINTETGEWADWATGAKGTDAISYYAHLNGLEQGEACRKLAKELGISIPGGGKPPPKAHPKLPPPPESHPKLGKPSKRYDYLDKDGVIEFCVYRFDSPDKSKKFSQCSFINGKWVWKAPPNKKPMYNLPEILTSPGTPLAYAEGEQATDALPTLFPNRIKCTVAGGCGAKLDDVDFSPVKGRDVVLWPDHDEPGREYMRKVRDKMIEAGAACVRILKVPPENGIEYPEKWDAFDAVAEGWTAERVATLDELVPLQSPTAKKLTNNQNPSQSEAASYMESMLTGFAFDAAISEWRKYVGGYWPIVHKDYVRAAMRKIIDQDKEMFSSGYSASYLRGITELFQLNKLIPEKIDSDHLLSFPNGILDLHTMELIPHDPKQFIKWQLPFCYDPAATCEPIQEWLLEAFDTDGIVQVLRAYLNAIVNGRSDLHRFLELVGPGGSGKGTFLWLAESLVGGENTFITELKHLEQSRFETANIYGKRLVLITDSACSSRSVDVLKTLTGGDPIRFEKKNVQGGMHFKPRAMVVIAANELIQSPDYTSGLRRRRITVFANNAVPLEKQRPLQDEFTKYLPGLLNWVLQLSDKEVTEFLKGSKGSETLLETQREALLETNPMVGWLDARCVCDPGVITFVGTATKNVGGFNVGKYENSHQWLYPNYVEFCESVGATPLKQQRFSRILDDLCRNQIRLKDVYRGNKTRYGRPFHGLRLRREQVDDSLPSPLDKLGKRDGF